MKLLLPLLAALTLPEGLDADDVVKMADGVAFLGVDLPKEVKLGDTLAMDFYFRSAEPLPPDVLSFLHIESNTSTCRYVHDRRPALHEGGIIKHHVEVPMTPSGVCQPQRLEIYTGLWNRKTGARWEVVDPPTIADRIYAGSVRLLSEDGQVSTGRRRVGPGASATSRVLGILGVWTEWVVGLLVALLGTLLLRRWLRSKQPVPEDAPGFEAPRWQRLATRGGVLVILMAGILAAVDFVKDDAYIYFRYAHNLAGGEGPVFNSHEAVDAGTSFLWILVMAPFEWLNLDLFQVCEVLGTGFAIWLLVVVTRTAVYFRGPGRDFSHLWAATWLASSSALALWSTSGMEQALAMLLPIASALLLWRSENDDDTKGALWSGVLMGLGCMARPEIHLIGFIVGMPLVIKTIARRKLERTTVRWFAGLFAVTVPFHLFRWAYYGSFIPNTFYVKTGDSGSIVVAGLKKLREMFDFNGTGILLVLSPLAFIDRKFLKEKLVMLCVSVAFMAYIVKVGVDEMRWHRLYLPALPFLVVLAAVGLRNFFDALVRLVRWERVAWIAWPLGWAAVLAAVMINFSFTYESKGGFNGRGDLSGEYHPDIGKFITRHERPRALVAFQDMGSTPYHAPDIDFLDFIGLTDETIARSRYEYGLHAFMTTSSHRNQRAYDAEMREYFYQQNPEWVILTTYVVGGPNTARVSYEFGKNPAPRSLEPEIGRNSYQFGIYNQRFKEHYHHVRTWPRSVGYYLSLFRRADLWQQVPGEVVLDALPADTGGVRASFEGGLELLGSELQAEVTQKHEFFITTWWKTPGPMAPDLNFFVHVEREGYRAPREHIPGDWMWPADRWRAGDVIEDRYLFQLPWRMQPGTYKVYLGAYRRVSGQRLAVTAGPRDAENRILLGEIEVTTMLPFVDHLIKKTDIELHRKYPERIIDSGRWSAPDKAQPGG